MLGTQSLHRFYALVFVTCFGLFSATAQSAPRSYYVLTLVNVSAEPSPEVLDAVALLIEALQEHPDVEYKDLQAMLQAGADDRHYANLVSAKTSFETGRKAFKAGDFEDAIESLETAVQFLSDSYGHLPSPTLYKDSMLYLAASQWQGLEEGEDIEATEQDVRALLKQLVVQFPNLFYAKGRFSDEFNTVVTDEINRARNLPTGTIRVDTESGLPAMAYINGLYRGVTPVTVPNLPVGTHMVRVLDQSSTVGQRRATVRESRITNLTIELEPSNKGDILAGLLDGLRADLMSTDDRARTTRDLKGIIFSEYVVLIRGNKAASGTEIQAALFNLVSGSRVRTARGVFGSRAGPRAGSRLANLLLSVPASKGNTAQPVASGGLLKKWWFWAGAAAVVTGGVVTTLLLTAGGDGSSGLPKDNNGALMINF
ncbi:MAG: hypothetical protein CMH54_01585 [Myxococcales bacterium]|nr:hypothetical protein [Myxococcales bacterium]